MSRGPMPFDAKPRTRFGPIWKWSSMPRSLLPTLLRMLEHRLHLIEIAQGLCELRLVVDIFRAQPQRVIGVRRHPQPTIERNFFKFRASR